MNKKLIFIIFFAVLIINFTEKILAQNEKLSTNAIPFIMFSVGEGGKVSASGEFIILLTIGENKYSSEFNITDMVGANSIEFDNDKYFHMENGHTDRVKPIRVEISSLPYQDIDEAIEEFTITENKEIAWNIWVLNSLEK